MTDRRFDCASWSRITIRPTRFDAITRLMESKEADEVLTGVLYVNTQAPNFIDMLNMTDEPLATLPESVTRPSRKVLEECMEELQ